MKQNIKEEKMAVPLSSVKDSQSSSSVGSATGKLFYLLGNNNENASRVLLAKKAGILNEPK